MSYPAENLNPTFSKVEVTSLILKTLSYGLLTAFSGISVYLLAKNGRSYRARQMTLIYVAIMLALATIWYITGAHWFMRWMFPGSDVIQDMTPRLVSNICAMMQYLLSDGVLLFRMCKIYDGRWCVIALPACLYFLSLIFGGLTEVTGANYDHDAVAMNHMCFLAFSIFTIIFNAFTTLAIAYKTLPLLRDTKYSPTQTERNAGIWRLAPAMVVLMENGALYSIIGIAQAASRSTGSHSSEILSTIWQISSFLGPALVILCISIHIPSDMSTRRSGDPGSSDRNTHANIEYQSASARSILKPSEYKSARPVAVPATKKPVIGDTVDDV